MEFNRPEYGTDSSPAQLIRNKEGSYFLYESSQEGCLLSWSATVNEAQFLRTLLELHETSDDPTNKRDPDFSLRAGIIDLDTASLLEIEGDAVLEHLRQGRGTEFLQVTSGHTEYAWLKPYERFADRPTIHPEVTVFSNDIDLDLARHLARRTGDEEFFNTAQCEILVRRHGVMQRFDF